MSENHCAICLDEFTKDTVYKTNCKHKFHIDCAYTWLKHNHSCPLCRKYNTFLEIMNRKVHSNIDYRINKKYNLKSQIIKPFEYDGNTYEDIFQQLKNAVPCAWINILTANNIAPLYILFSNDNKKYIYIDYHLRQLLLWHDDIIHYLIKKEKDIKKKI